MSDISSWTTSAGSNNAAAPDGFPEGMAPSGVNDSAREVMAAIRRGFEDLPWFNWGHRPVQQTAKTFLVSFTATQIYTPRRALRLNDATTLYATVKGSSASGTNTLVSITGASATSSLTGVSLAMYEAVHPIVTDWGRGSVSRCASKNNSGAATTSWDMAANVVVVRNPTTGVVTYYSAPTATVDITAASQANGRDQAGAFTASTFIHFYWIAKDALGTIKGIASASGPTTGPTLPSGYTSWTYDSSVLLDGSVHMLNMYALGGRMYYQARQSLLASGSATSETSLVSALNALVPSGVATDYCLGGYVDCNSSGGTSAATFNIYVASTVVFSRVFVEDPLQTGGQATFDSSGFSQTVPATGYLAYRWTGVSGSPNAEIDVQSFGIPNG